MLRMNVMFLALLIARWLVALNAGRAEAEQAQVRKIMLPVVRAGGEYHE